MSDHAIANAKGWLESIVEMVDALQSARESAEDPEETALDEARRRIEESPLSVRVRDGWRQPGSRDGASAEEYEILLSTGGPALRICGELGAHDEPDDWPNLQWQDWGTQWTNYEMSGEERAAVTEFARCFYWEECD